LYFYRNLEMNILFLTFQGDVAGSTYSISYLAKGMADRGHNIYVGCRLESLLYKMLANTNVNLIPMTFSGRFDLQNIKQIRNAVLQYSIQVVNAQSSYDRYTSVFAKWIYRLNTKIVHTRRQISKSVGGFFPNLVLVKGTDKVVAVSEGVKVSLVKTGIPEDHIEVVYNGTPQGKYENVDQSKTEQLKIKYGIHSGEFVIGCVSRLKNQEQIVKALELINFKVKLIFVGIDQQPHWEEITKKYHVPHEVYYTGTVNPEEALSYYGLFTIKILASTMEGLSQSLLEAMALGVPVIATNASGNSELISHEVNGLLFEDGDIKELSDYITQLHNDGNLRKKFIKKGKETAFQDFSIESTVKGFEDLFEQLIKS